ncbi:MAG: hypothetical protein OXI51_00010 [Chloroflexota bacterium]|nr:hypothetical protein [Chloroflexota bacterium]
MTDEADVAMLAALDRFVTRYGPRPVMRLAEALRDPQRARELADALEGAATKAGREPSRPASRRRERVGMAVLKELRLSDPEKHIVVTEIRRQLLNRTILPSMDELRRFAMMHGLSIGKASSRTAAIAPFLRSLAQLSTPEIVSLRESIGQSGVGERSLDRWREVIVRPPPSDADLAETNPDAPPPH